MWIALLGGLVVTAEAQPQPAAPPDSVQAAVEAGVAAFEAGDYTGASDALMPLWQADPAYVHAQLGAAAYWLGRALEAQDEVSGMRLVWQGGLRALDAGGRFDVRLADAYLSDLFQAGLDANPAYADYLYLNLLARLGTERSNAALRPEEARILTRHVAQLWPVLPEDVRARVRPEDPSAKAPAWTFTDEAGRVLLGWWRQADPLPASTENERLREHLRRVAHARTAYAHAQRRSGFDDRGEVYVRLGEPSRATEVTFNDPRLIDAVYQPGVSVSPSDFPENEFWLYGHVDRAAYYLFVRQADGYRIGETDDLLPRQLRTGFMGPARGGRKSIMAISVLRSVFEQLAMIHPDFELRWGDVEAYVNQLDIAGNERKAAFARQAASANVNDGAVGDSSGAGNPQTGDSDPFGPAFGVYMERPQAFAQSLVTRSRSEDEQARYRRVRYAPPEYAPAIEEDERLPMLARTARFMDTDGTTRTEIYWVPEPGSLRPTPDQREDLQDLGYTAFGEYVVRVTAVQRAPDHSDRVVNRNHYLLTELPSREAAIPAQQTVVQGDTGMYHLAVQWDQHLVNRFSTAETEEGVTLGHRVKVATLRRDTLQALASDPSRLEMSDLKPLSFPDGTDALTASFADATLFPFERITRDTPLVLYFELYNLAFDADDRTRYTVTYEVARQEEGGLRLLRRRGDDRTSVSTRYEGSDRRAGEYILLDLTEWQGTGEVELIVRVTDEVTGQEVERSLSYELIDGDA